MPNGIRSRRGTKPRSSNIKNKTKRNNSYISTDEIEPNVFFANKFSLREFTKHLKVMGGEMVTMHKLTELNSRANSKFENKQLILLYKIINLIYYSYTNVKMSWSEWLILTPEGNDMLHQFVITPAKFIVFISAFYFLPKDHETTDWFFSNIAHYMAKHSYGFHMIRWGIVSQNQRWIMGLISSITVRKVGTAFIDSVNRKLGKDSDTIIKNNINDNDALTREGKRELLELYGVIMGMKSINSNIDIKDFVNSIMNGYYTDAQRIGIDIIKSKQRNNRTIKSMNPRGKLN